MTSLKSFNRRVGSLFSVAALALAAITPGFVPVFASAAELTERSVELTSSSKGAEDVTYKITFTPSAVAAAVVLNFCENSPLIEDACDEPAGFDATGATEADFTVAPTTASVTAEPDELNAIVLTGAIADEETTIDLAGVTNPDAAGPLYMRIVTYSDAGDALLYEATDLGDSVVDQGTAAISITDSIGVSAAVLESMTFCVSKSAPTEDCGGTDAPTVKLGEDVGGGILALNSLNTSEGSVFSQISTNAATGAVVNLKSSAAGCGGLVRAGATNCDIEPATDGTGIDDGEALFGVKVGTAAGVGGNANGTFRAFGDIPYYSDSVFKLNYVALDASGVTSPYGDQFLDTDGAPANNQNIEITFGASVSNSTPAGLYSTDLSLIATGKF